MKTSKSFQGWPLPCGRRSRTFAFSERGSAENERREMLSLGKHRCPVLLCLWVGCLGMVKTSKSFQGWRLPCGSSSLMFAILEIGSVKKGELLGVNYRSQVSVLGLSVFCRSSCLNVRKYSLLLPI